MDDWLTLSMLLKTDFHHVVTVKKTFNTNLQGILFRWRIIYPNFETMKTSITFILSALILYTACKHEIINPIPGSPQDTIVVNNPTNPNHLSEAPAP